ncbi:Protein of unknown function DUF1285 [Syntrophomonas zehnderi OL-4]|uniref:DUF1285 domain-containing protein n=1 Tax=Syntrophomonas zehnderi OL-4 TaxID=690567 RepID=A0A0E4G9P8_9FIRM|nr:DUF1285 domain-containing protein [Syntrophomonas zehnderi]CFX18958.1 Protein of unknown function DUF1285 [Syntrophomonas zehnderi OL-4]
MDYQEIKIGRDGKWYFGEAEMFRRNILQILARNINQDEDGNYFIQMGQETNPLIVEDVPFLATGLVEKENQPLKLVFHDLQEMVLDHELKLYLRGDVPYISFRWEADTRLSRGVYWKLSDYFDFRGEEIYIVPPLRFQETQ